MIDMAGYYDVRLLYGEEAAEIYNKLYELTGVPWMRIDECHPYYDEDRLAICCSECDAPLSEYYLANYCQRCGAEIIH